MTYFTLYSQCGYRMYNNTMKNNSELAITVWGASLLCVNDWVGGWLLLWTLASHQPPITPSVYEKKKLETIRTNKTFWLIHAQQIHCTGIQNLHTTTCLWPVFITCKSTHTWPVFNQSECVNSLRYLLISNTNTNKCYGQPQILQKQIQ